MRSFICCSTLLIIMALLVSGISADVYRRPSKVITSCCKAVSRSRIPYNIISYKVQNALTPCVKAVIFYTKEVGAVCSNPDAKWVKEKMKELPQADDNV
ncbi:eotaxin-like [Polypterus senegalus]|uniref:eotaxin-like n=1 Tax=Polypterus senegalus TaxID=55291 RepID=UPI0019628657|nr:eotaxin-like [Polypterus senegalus]